jgi:hypothetical protein
MKNDYRDQNLKSALMFGAFAICFLITAIIWAIIN